MKPELGAALMGVLAVLALSWPLASVSMAGDPPEPPLFLEVTEIVRKPSEGFCFVRPLRGLEVLAAGELLGEDGTLEIRVRESCRALLPNEGVEVGGDLVYLAREIPGGGPFTGEGR